MKSEIRTIRNVRNENITPAEILAYMDRYRAEHPDMKVWLDPETFEIQARRTRVRAVIMYDEYSAQESPMKAWDHFGTFLDAPNGSGPWSGAMAPFCNSRFSDDPDVRDLGNFRYIFKDLGMDLARRYGALVVGVRDGVLIAGHDEIVREYGYDNQHSRELAQGVLEAEAHEYDAWARGEVFGIEIIRDFELDGEDVEYREDIPEDVETLDSCWGFIGYEWAEEGAREMLAPYLGAEE